MTVAQRSERRTSTTWGFRSRVMPCTRKQGVRQGAFGFGRRLAPHDQRRVVTINDRLHVQTLSAQERVTIICLGGGSSFLQREFS